MKRFAKFGVIAAALGLVCALGLTGCFGGGAKVDPTGFWAMTTLVDADGTVSITEEDADMMEALGLGTSLEFKADGTGVFTVVGAPVDFTWKDSEIIFFDKEVLPFTISGNELKADLDGDVMTFLKR